MKGEADDESLRVITTFPLACLTFLCVCGGPYGIEIGVMAAGAFPTLLAILLLPFFWGFPQALLCAELSTMMDANGGYVLWVRRGLGNFWGFMSSYNSMGSNLLNMPAYIALAESYVALFVQQTWGYVFGFWLSAGVKFFFIFSIYLLNLRGMGSVSFVSSLMTILILIPFAIEPMVGWRQLNPKPWMSTLPSIDWSLFASSILWNYQGWDGVGTFAGEVKNTKRTYPMGVSLALLMMTLSYLVPVAVGASVIPDFTTWQAGELTTIATAVAGWLGIWISIGALLANIGQCNVYMATSARATWAMSQRRTFPKPCGCLWVRYNSPVAALTFQLITTSVFMMFNFTELVVLNTFFNNVSCMLEALSFIALKYKEPKTPRPYVVPGGMIGGWMVFLLNMIVILGASALQTWSTWVIVGGCQIVFAVLYLIRKVVVKTELYDKSEASFGEMFDIGEEIGEMRRSAVLARRYSTLTRGGVDLYASVVPDVVYNETTGKYEVVSKDDRDYRTGGSGADRPRIKARYMANVTNSGEAKPLVGSGSPGSEYNTTSSIGDYPPRGSPGPSINA